MTSQKMTSLGAGKGDEVTGNDITGAGKGKMMSQEMISWEMVSRDSRGKNPQGEIHRRCAVAAAVPVPLFRYRPSLLIIFSLYLMCRSSLS